MYIVPTFLQDMSQNEMEAEWSRHIIKHGSLLQPVLRPEQSSTTTTTTNNTNDQYNDHDRCTMSQVLFPVRTSESL